MSYTVERQRFQVSQKRIFQKMFKKAASSAPNPYRENIYFMRNFGPPYLWKSSYERAASSAPNPYRENDNFMRNFGYPLVPTPVFLEKTALNPVRIRSA